MVPTLFSVGKTPTLWVFSQVSIHIHKRHIKHCITLKLLVSPSPSSFNFTHSLIHYIKNSALNCSEEGSHQFSMSSWLLQSSLSFFSSSSVLIGLDHHGSLAEWPGCFLMDPSVYMLVSSPGLWFSEQTGGSDCDTLSLCVSISYFLLVKVSVITMAFGLSAHSWSYLCFLF